MPNENETSLNESKAKIGALDVPSATARAQALELAKAQKEAYVQQARASQIDSMLHGLNNEALDTFLEQLSIQTREDVQAANNKLLENNEEGIDVEETIQNHIDLIKGNIFNKHAYTNADGKEIKLDSTQFKELQIPPLEKEQIDGSAYFVKIEGTEFFICAGTAYAFDPLYFDQGSNVIAHMGKSLGATPNEDQLVVLKMQAGSMEKNAEGEEFFNAIGENFVIAESDSARDYKYTDNTNKEKPLGIHLGKVTLNNPKSPRGKVVFGDREITTNGPFTAYVHIQSLVPGMPLHKFMQTDKFKGLSELERVELGQKIVQALQEFERTTKSFHRDIRPNNIMIDVAPNGDYVACIDTGATLAKQKAAESKLLVGLTAETTTNGEIKFYSHPEIVSLSQITDSESFRNGTYTAVKLTYTDKHEAYAMRVTLQAMGLNIPLPQPEDDLSTYPDDSLAVIATELQSLKEKIVPPVVIQRARSKAVITDTRAGHIIENDQLDIKILRAFTNTIVEREITENIQDILNEYSGTGGILEFPLAIQVLQRVLNAADTYTKTHVNIPQFTTLRIAELHRVYDDYLKKHCTEAINLAGEVTHAEADYNELRPLLIELTNALTFLPIAPEKKNEFDILLENLSAHLARKLTDSPTDLIQFKTNLNAVFANYNQIKTLVRTNEPAILFKAFDEGLRALQASIENNLSAITQKEKAFAESKAKPVAIKDNKRKPITQSKDVYTFTEEPIVLQLTDWEGDWDKVNRNISTLNLELESLGIKTPIEIKVDENGGEYIKIPEIEGKPIFLAFGGDATDGGASDTRIRKLLLNTKLMQPDNFNLNIGNRDVLDLRYLEELPAIEEILVGNSLPTWDDKKTFAMFIIEKLASNSIPVIYDSSTAELQLRLRFLNTVPDKDKEQFIRDLLKHPNNIANLRRIFASIPDEHIKQFLYMQWADQFTMGRPKRLLYKRQELALAKRDAGGPHALIGLFKNHTAAMKALTKDYQEAIIIFEDLRAKSQIPNLDLQQLLEDYQDKLTSPNAQRIFSQLYMAIGAPLDRRLTTLTNVFNSLDIKKNYDAAILQELTNFDRLLTPYVTDTEVVEYIMQSVQKDGINEQLLKVSNAAAKVGTESAGYVSLMHGGPQKEALTIDGITYSDYDLWMAAANQQIQNAIEKVITNPVPRTTISPTNQMPEYMRLALPNGKQFPDNDVRNKHCHTGTVIACQCFKFKQIKLSNGQVITQKVHDIDADVRQMALDTGKVYAWATGHKPTGSDDLGTMYAVPLSRDGTIQTQTSTDITYALDPQMACATAFVFGETTFQQTMIRGRFPNPNSALGEITTTNMPIIGVGAPKLMHAPLMVGSTLFAPQFTPGNITPFSAHVATTPVFAWNIVDIKTKTDGSISAITMQRMEGENANVTLTYQVDALSLRNLNSFTNLIPVEVTNLSEKQKIIVDSEVPVKPVVPASATLLINTKLRDSLLRILEDLPNLTTPNLPPLTALSKMVLETINEITAQELAGSLATTTLNQQAIGILSVLDAAKNDPAFKRILGVRGLEGIQRTLLKSIVEPINTNTEYDTPSLSFMERAFFEEHQDFFNDSTILSNVMQKALANPTMRNTATDPQWAHISHFFRTAIVKISTLDSEGELGLTNIFKEQLVADEPTYKLLKQITALDDIIDNSQDHEFHDEIVIIATQAKQDILDTLLLEADKSVDKATQATTSHVLGIDTLKAKTAVVQARAALRDAIEALKLVSILSTPMTDYKADKEREYRESLDELYTIVDKIFSLDEQDVAERKELLFNAIKVSVDFAEKDANFDDQVRLAFLSVLDSTQKLDSAIARINEPVFAHTMSEFTELANELHSELAGEDIFDVIPKAQELRRQLDQAIYIQKQAFPNSYQNNGRLLSAEEALKLLVKGSNTPTVPLTNQLQLEPGDDGKYALEMLTWLPLRDEILRRYIGEANTLAQTRTLMQRVDYSKVKPIDPKAAKKLQDNLNYQARSCLELIVFLDNVSNHTFLKPETMSALRSLFQHEADVLWPSVDVTDPLGKTLEQVLADPNWATTSGQIRAEIKEAMADATGVKGKNLQAVLGLLDTLEASNALRWRVQAADVVSKALHIKRRYAQIPALTKENVISFGNKNHQDRLKMVAHAHTTFQSISSSTLAALDTELVSLYGVKNVWSSDHDTNEFLDACIALLNEDHAIDVFAKTATNQQTMFSKRMANYTQLKDMLKNIEKRQDLDPNVRDMFKAALNAHIAFDDNLAQVLSVAPTAEYINFLAQAVDSLQKNPGEHGLYITYVTRLKDALYAFDRLHLLSNPTRYIAGLGTEKRLDRGSETTLEVAKEVLANASEELGAQYEYVENAFADAPARKFGQDTRETLLGMYNSARNSARGLAQRKLRTSPKVQADNQPAATQSNGFLDTLFRLAGKPTDFSGGVPKELYEKLKVLDQKVLAIAKQCGASAVYHVDAGDEKAVVTHRNALDTASAELKKLINTYYEEKAPLDVPTTKLVAMVNEALDDLSFEYSAQALEELRKNLRDISAQSLPKAIKTVLGHAIQAKIAQLELELRVMSFTNKGITADRAVIATVRQSEEIPEPIFNEEGKPLTTNYGSMLTDEEDSIVVVHANEEEEPVDNAGKRFSRSESESELTYTGKDEEEEPIVVNESVEDEDFILKPKVATNHESLLRLLDSKPQEFSVAKYLQESAYKPMPPSTFADSFRNICGHLAKNTQYFKFNDNTLSRTSPATPEMDIKEIQLVPTAEAGAIQATFSGSNISWETMLKSMLDSGGKFMEFKFRNPSENEALNFVRSLLNVAPNIGKCPLQFAFEDKATADVIQSVLQKGDLKDASGNDYTPEVIEKLQTFLKPALEEHVSTKLRG